MKLTSAFRHILSLALLALNTIAAGVTLAALWGGTIDPYTWVVPALLSMMLPLVLVADVVIMALDIIFRRLRYIFIILGSWLIGASALLTYSPLNLNKPEQLTPDERERSFTLLTYNVLHFLDFRGEMPDLDTNATIDYILSTDADIVSLQEADAMMTWPLWHITSEQIARLTERYPYRIINVNNQLSVLSKYPMEWDNIPLEGDAAQRMALFHFDIKGRRVSLFNVHLASIGLDMADKALYQRLFDTYPLSEHHLRKELSDVKHQLIGKLAVAFRRRADQARTLRHVMDSVGGDFIVAGDFNDIPGCFAIRTIRGDDMSDAYAECALGPTITYHGNRFYFRIDHVLYRGAFRATAIESPRIPSSDHYPVFTTFVFDQ
ncbi:MAG: endonuclease/exonuclease/phosphatase family protein [Duncaniella sp.]|nr:endonuclease/exonuclease/phosphatase family protein [Duncaniella sp.]